MLKPKLESLELLSTRFPQFDAFSLWPLDILAFAEYLSLSSKVSLARTCSSIYDRIMIHCGVGKVVKFIQTLKWFKEECKYDLTVNENYCLRKACKNGELTVVKFLLSCGCDASAKENYCLHYACKFGHLDIVRLLLSYGVDASSGNNYAICSASTNGYFEIVKILLQYNVDPSARENNPIRSACEYGHMRVAELLLKQEAVDPAAKDNYAIAIASANGYLDIVKLLLKCRSVDPNPGIIKAQENGHPEIAELIRGQPFLSIKVGPPRTVQGSSLYTEYELIVKTNLYNNGKDSTILLYRRYSHFREFYNFIVNFLHCEKINVQESLPPIPSRNYFGRFSKSTINKRTTAFQRLMDVVSHYPRLRELKETQIFLDPVANPVSFAVKNV